MKPEVASLLLLVSIAGLLLLKPVTVELKDVKEIGKTYRLCGVLSPSKELKHGCIYWFLEGTSKIKAVQFFGGCVAGYTCIYARLDSYRGEKELVILALD